MTNTTITMDTIKKGNCQFNATSAKSFRTTLAKWHNATFKIADELLAKNDRVKALRTLSLTLTLSSLTNSTMASLSLAQSLLLIYSLKLTLGMRLFSLKMTLWQSYARLSLTDCLKLKS